MSVYLYSHSLMAVRSPKSIALSEIASQIHNDSEETQGEIDPKYRLCADWLHPICSNRCSYQRSTS